RHPGDEEWRARGLRRAGAQHDPVRNRHVLAGEGRGAPGPAVMEHVEHLVEALPTDAERVSEGFHLRPVPAGADTEDESAAAAPAASAAAAIGPMPRRAGRGPSFGTIAPTRGATGTSSPGTGSELVQDRQHAADEQLEGVERMLGRQAGQETPEAELRERDAG